VVVVPALFLGRYGNVVVVPALFLGRYGNVVVVPALFLGRYGNVVMVPTLFLVEQRGANDITGLPGNGAITGPRRIGAWRASGRCCLAARARPGR
jgi:hypothetical protein